MVTKKILGGIVAVVAVAVLAVIVWFLTNINYVIKRAVQSVGSELAQSSVLLESVDANLTEGSVALNGITIENPEGYHSSYLFYGAQISVKIDPKSLTSDVIIIEQVSVSGVGLVAEQKGLDTNLKALVKSVRKATSAKEDGASASGPTFILKKLSFTDSNIKIVLEDGSEYPLIVPAMVLGEFGGKDSPLTANELAAEVVLKYLRQVSVPIRRALQENGRSLISG